MDFFDKILAAVAGLFVVLGLLFTNFHLATDQPLHRYGAHCHYDQVRDWLGAVTVMVNCKPGATLSTTANAAPPHSHGHGHPRS